MQSTALRRVGRHRRAIGCASVIAAQTKRRDQVLRAIINSVRVSDWKFVTPLAEFGEFQLTPIEGSPASCAVYSTVCTVGPWLLSVTSTSVPGASKFWNPIFGPRSRGAAGANAVPAEADTGLALPEYWKPAKALK